MKRAHFYLPAGLSLFCCAWLIGCADQNHSKNGHESRSLSLTDSRSGSQPKTIVLEHDFGVVRPGERLRRLFTVENPSGRPWKLQKVTRTCTCSVARATGETIDAGASQEFEFLYRAPSQRSDDSESVFLAFDPDDAPKIELRVKARVRDPLTATPAAVDLGQLAIGKSTRRTLRIENFGEQDWTNLQALSASEWATVERVVLERSASTPPRQVWLVECLFRNSGLEPTLHQGQLRLVAAGAEIARDVPLSVVSVGPVSAVPSTLMFGTVRRNAAAQASVLLSFTGIQPPESPDDIGVSCNLPCDLRLQWKEITQDRWRLTAHMAPEEHSGDLISGKVTLSFPALGIGDLELPVYARLASD